MKPKYFLLLLMCAVIVSCKNKKQTLPDKLPEQTDSEQIQFNTWLSPPPPGKTDSSDTTSVIAPEKVSRSDRIYEVLEVDFLPSYPNGGWKAFSNYLQSIRYPKELKDKNLTGYLIVSFVVEKDGSISNIEPIKSIDKAIDNEIINALQNMPTWKPGKKDGLYVRSKFGFTLIFED